MKLLQHFLHACKQLPDSSISVCCSVCTPCEAAWPKETKEFAAAETGEAAAAATIAAAEAIPLEFAAEVDADNSVSNLNSYLFR